MGVKPKQLCNINGCKFARSMCRVHRNHYLAQKQALWRKNAGKVNQAGQTGDREKVAEMLEET